MPGVFHPPDVENPAAREHKPAAPTPEAPPVQREAYIAALAGCSIALHITLRYGFGVAPLAFNLPLMVALAVGGLPLILELFKKLIAAEFGSDLLAGASIVASALMGEYLVGAIVVLMLSGGTALEQYATRRASSVLSALAKRMPEIAHRSVDS